MNLNRPRAASPTPTKPKTDKLFATFYKDFQNESSWIFNQVKQAFARDAEAEGRGLSGKILGSAPTVLAHAQRPEHGRDVFLQIQLSRRFRRHPPGRHPEDTERSSKNIINSTTRSSASTSPPSKRTNCARLFSTGMEPLPFWKRIVEWILGNAAVSAYHEQAPRRRRLFLRQRNRPRQELDALRLVDLAPTILYYLGLPVGKDMDGVVRGSLFETEFTDENPVLTISSYEDVTIEREIIRMLREGQRMILRIRRQRAFGRKLTSFFSRSRRLVLR